MSSPAYGTAIEALRTPDERFEGLPDYDYEPHYVTVRDGLRVHVSGLCCWTGGGALALASTAVTA